MAAKGSLDSLSFVGIDGLEVSANDLSVEVNRSSQTLAGVTVATGPSTDPIDMSFASTADVTRASGALTIDVFGFVYVAGTFAFEKVDVKSGNDVIGPGGAAGADGIDDSVASTLKIGGTLTEAFIGAGRGTVDEVGLKATNGAFGVVIASTVDQSLTTQAASKMAAKGSLGALSFVGVEDLTVSATNLTVEVNRSGETLSGAMKSSAVPSA